MKQCQRCFEEYNTSHKKHDLVCTRPPAYDNSIHNAINEFGKEKRNSMVYLHGNYQFGLLKQNLSVDQKVVIGRTGDDTLDNQTGVILGKSFDNVCDAYIILLDIPYHGQKAINLTEACICPI